MDYEWFGDTNANAESPSFLLKKYISRLQPTHHVRVYAENGRLKFQALEHPLFAYGSMTYLLSKKNPKYSHKLIFYFDDVWVSPETSYKVAQQIFEAMGW